MPDMLKDQFTLPIYIDLGATFLYALTGALVAIRRQYDVIGLFVLALVTGVGGALIRDGIFIQNGPPVVMTEPRYLLVILAGCFVAALFRHRIDRIQKLFLLADALGLGAYAVVGVERSLNAGLPAVASVMVGVINACGDGLLRDVLVRVVPLLFKPGQFYVLAALLGAGLFALLIIHFALPTERSAYIAIASTFVLRELAILFNWTTKPVSQGPWTIFAAGPDASSASAPPPLPPHENP